MAARNRTLAVPAGMSSYALPVSAVARRCAADFQNPAGIRPHTKRTTVNTVAIRAAFSQVIKTAAANGLDHQQILETARSLFPPPPVFRAELFIPNDDSIDPAPHLDMLVTGKNDVNAFDHVVSALRKDGCLTEQGETYLARLAQYTVPPDGPGMLLGETWWAVRFLDGSAKVARVPKPVIKSML